MKATFTVRFEVHVYVADTSSLVPPSWIVRYSSTPHARLLTNTSRAWQSAVKRANTDERLQAVRLMVRSTEGDKPHWLRALTYQPEHATRVVDFDEPIGTWGGKRKSAS